MCTLTEDWGPQISLPLTSNFRFLECRSDYALSAKFMQSLEMENSVGFNKHLLINWKSVTWLSKLGSQCTFNVLSKYT